MPRTVVVAALVTTLLAGSASCAQMPARSARSLLEQGIALLEQGRNRAAIERLEDALERDPTLARGYVYLARAYLATDDWIRALAVVRDGIARVPPEQQRALIADLVSDLVDSALGLLRQGKIDQATTVLTRTLALDPHSRAARDALLSALLAQGRELLSRGDWSRAAERFRRAVELAPATLDAYLGLAQAFARSGRLGDALDAVRRALELTPRNPEAQDLLERLLRT